LDGGFVSSDENSQIDKIIPDQVGQADLIGPGVAEPTNIYYVM